MLLNSHVVLKQSIEYTTEIVQILKSVFKNALDDVMLTFKAYFFPSNDTLSQVNKDVSEEVIRNNQMPNEFVIWRFSVKADSELNFEKMQIEKKFYFMGKMYNI